MRSLINKIKRILQKNRLFYQVGRLNKDIVTETSSSSPDKPVVFFNASTRLEGLNLNAAFSMISSWGIQLAGREVYHFACHSGMSQCVLGAGHRGPTDSPPCQDCIRYTRLFTGAANRFWFEYHEDPQLREIITDMPVDDLKNIVYKARPLGKLVITSTRWILRRHHLLDDEVTRYLLSEYILSAHSIAEEFERLIMNIQPEVVVVFNGLQYPEAVVRWIAKNNDIRVITHEVNLQPYSAFFTDRQATIYPMDIPEDFQLSTQQDQILDGYLEKRFKGDFKMAGIKFWPSMNELSGDIVDTINEYRYLVPVFTNVIFDTSQAHANTHFSTMFEWLDLVLDVSKKFPKTLFIIRAHPDEMRKGKSSQESVLSWINTKDLSNIPNVLFIEPDETESSYELIRRSKFTMVYNSSIGLEAALMGKPVLCAGKARYTQYPTVFYPDSRQEYENQLHTFLSSSDIDYPIDQQATARKFLFFQLYRASLTFEDLLEEHATPGYVQLKRFPIEKLKPGQTRVIDTIVKGILNQGKFVLDTD